MNFLFLLAAEEGVHHDNGVHLAGDIKEVYWGSLAFFVVLGLVVWKAGPLIKRAMAGRTDRIEAELAEARSRREAAETALTASTSELPDLSEEEARIRVEANETAVRLKADLIAKAEAEAEAIRERGKADVANRKRQARADLSAEIGEATRRAAEVMVRDQLDGPAQSDLIESYINQVSQMS
jgi:F-type H+-transporting ATPase subunit b